MPVGASSPLAVNVRIIAATNADLAEAVAQGRFRRDFLDRLEVLKLRLPPLCERPEDIPLLLQHFLAAANGEEGTEVEPPARAEMEEVARTCAAKSIRVLKNAIRRLVVVKRHGQARSPDLIEAGLLPASARPGCSVTATPQDSGGISVAVDAEEGTTFGEIMAAVARAVTDAALARHGRRVADAMRALRMSKPTWYRVRKT